MSSKSFKSLVLLFMFTSGAISGIATNFAACMENPKEPGKCNYSKVNIKKNSTKTGSKNSVLDAMNNISGEFLECCREFIPDINYKNKVYYFLELLDRFEFFDKELIRSAVNSFKNFFGGLGDKGRAIFADLWALDEFDETAVAGFLKLVVAKLIPLTGFYEGFSLFLKDSNKVLIVQIFKELGKADYEMLNGFNAFLACVGNGIKETGPHFGKFNSDRVFLALNKLLSENDGSIDCHALLGLMRVIRGLGWDGPRMANFVSILADVSASVPKEIFAGLLREFSYLKEEGADWASKNFANLLDCRCREGYKNYYRCDVSYNVKKRLENANFFESGKFVKYLATIKPESFPLERFAKYQGIKEIVVPRGPSDDLDVFA